METKSINTDFKIIKVCSDTHKRLDALHMYRRETFDEIIVRLIDHWDKNHTTKEEPVAYSNATPYVDKSVPNTDLPPATKSEHNPGN